ncbi:MAG: hypothetical protein ACYDA8_10270 [Deferrisomatales bacterium]
MKRTTRLLLLLCLAAPPVAGAADTPPAPEALWPPAEKIEKPYTNDKCLEKCHGLPGFGAGAASGIARNLHVDKAGYLLSIHAQKGVECVDCHQESDPNFHPRTGYPQVDCRACHSEVPPEGVYPVDALKRLEAKGIKPPPKESRKAEGWMKTVHAKAWAEGNPAAPFCSHCHTAHYVRKSQDHGSTAHRSRLAETCGVCHVDQVRSYDVGGVLARFRIGAHGKGDLSSRHDVTECLSCHQGEAAHGEETVTGQGCPACHRVPKEKGGVEVASLHIKPLAENQPWARALRWAYGLGFWAVVAGGALLALVMGFSALYRKGEG